MTASNLDLFSVMIIILLVAVLCFLDRLDGQLTEAAFMKPTDLIPSTVEDYQEEVMFSLSSAHELAIQSVQKAQNRYKKYYDRDTKQIEVGSCLILGTALTALYPGKTQMSLQPRYTSQKKGRFKSTNSEPPDVLLN